MVALSTLSVYLDNRKKSSYILTMENQIKCTKAELMTWYQSMTIDELCEKLGYESHSSLYKLLKRAGIPLKGNPNLRKRGAVKLIDSE